MATATDDPIITTESSGLESDLGWAIGRVFRAYIKMFDAAFDQLPGGPRGFHILTAATKSAPRSQLALAQHLGVDRTVMTYLLDDLVAAGLVERQPDPADRRARRIVATDEGRELQRRLESHLAAAEDHLLSSLSDDERSTLRTLLRQVAERVQDLDPVVNTCDVVEDIRRELSGTKRSGTDQKRRVEGSSRPRSAS
ncbi:MarR family winged helix-turn-helix transcriptional regulator [Phytoactinopolyspora halotolerans]|uniref:Winged helix-turn-helix transcriptional regulator n=1 Tax=Phytoactinopolyspora halotolerans TaxID=1981512 RepID=A0A6L9S6F7_9ACTN|nr:MarR family winged helix-turn-helix transcriptional regulator [Phytoactinopolyspora halotolerans]NEE01045.1 winged helix-turn-helix transcriptional regulator [Phytoactinopolyspora halotolerans]